MRLLLLSLPVELAVMVFVAAGLALMLGLRVLARTMMVFGGCLIVLPVVLEGLFAALPDFILSAVLVVMFVALLFAAVKAIGVALLGNGAWQAMVGILAADVVRGMFQGVCRLIGLVVSGLLRLFRALVRL